MAWSAPATYAVSEIVTAAKLNTHIRDNLDYLKGNAGLVNLASSLDTTGTLRATGSVSPPTGAGTEMIYVGGTGYLLAYDRSAPGFRPLIMAGTTLEWDVASTPAMVLDASRNLGVGTTSPNGRLHGYDTISGFMHWKFDGVDGTARSVVPDGTGDVLYLLGGMGVTRASSGATAATSFLGASAVAPGGSQVLYSSGGDICALQVAANGAITVQRTGGALTYKVALWLLWL
jgi:hypothetical protein